MTSSVPMVDNQRIAEILTDAREIATSKGRKGTRLEDLDDSAVRDLVGATLAFLRSRPGSPSHVKGWTTVTAMHAGVMPWWTALLGEPNDGAEIKRLRRLRQDIYDYLGDELGLINKEPGQGSPIQVSPKGTDDVALGAVPGTEIVTITPAGVGFGTPEQNRAVELAAMKAAVDHYAGWDHTDVSAEKCGWDITFTRGGEEIHAEVKGRSGGKEVVLLTANELSKAATDGAWTLVLVTNALVKPRVTIVDRSEVVESSTPYVYRFEI
jgi:hypothetical protein